MKKLLLAAVLFTACSKTDVKQPRDANSGQSTFSEDELVSNACRSVTFNGTEGVYPYVKIVEYYRTDDKDCRTAENKGYVGIKYVDYLVNPETAHKNQVVQVTTFDEDFAIVYYDLFDTELNYKIVKGTITKIFKAKNNGLYTYFIQTAKTFENDEFDVSTFNGAQTIRDISPTVTHRTGNTWGTDVVEGVTYKWTSDITKAIEKVKGQDYPRRGIIKTIVKFIENGVEKTETHTLDYGNGENDIYCTVDGVTQTLPIEFWGEIASE